MRTSLYPWLKTNSVMLVNAGSLVATSAVTSVLGFTYWWLAARQFPPQVVGLASAAISAMTLLGTFAMLGLGTLLMGELPRQKGKAASLISTVLIVAGGVGGCLGIVFAVVSPYVSHDFQALRASPQDVILFAEIFRVAARGFDDQVISVLDEAVLSGSKNQLKAVGSVLHKAPRTFVWDQTDFVKRALRTAAGYGEEDVQMISGGLFAATTSGVRNGRPGHPFPEDIEQRNRSTELARTLPPGSVEANFYRSLEKSAKENIQMFEERGEQLMDGRSWE